MNPTDTVVYLGPSLSRDEAELILPAHYRPPARQADILSDLRRYTPKTIVLIDGEFGQSLSVWHKEILCAMAQGVVVFGAASMGALRAAELNSFGMLGVGKIYENYVDGVFDGDDEVALLYYVRDDRYVHLSIPLVNVRATLRAAESAGVVEPELSCKIVDAVGQQYFAERTIETLKEIFLDVSGTEAAGRRLGDWFNANYVDAKAIDAREVLKKAAEFVSPERPTRELPTSPCFDVLREHERWTDSVSGSIRSRSIYRYAALHHSRFRTIQEIAMLRMLVDILGDTIGLEVKATNIEESMRSLMETLELQSEDELAAWQRANDCEPAEFMVWARQRARERALMDWLVGQRGVRGFVAPVLDELRILGEYQTWKSAAALYEQQLQTVPPIHATDTFDVMDAIARHVSATSWDVSSDILRWMRDVGFEGSQELRDELNCSEHVRASLLRKLGKALDFDAHADDE